MVESMKIFPSMLSANPCCLGDELRELTPADGIHWDIMDGNFVKNITFGAHIVAAHREITSQLFDVHLMVESPEKHIKAFAEAGADVITIHAETTPHLTKVLDLIKSLGKKAGVALNPATSPDFLKYVDKELIDSILIMTVNPGESGQSFLYSQKLKIAKIAEMFPYGIEIGVDGGINNITINECPKATYVVAGSFIFSSDDYSAAIYSLKNASN